MPQQPLRTPSTTQEYLRTYLELLKAPPRDPLRMSTKPSWDYFRALSDRLRIL